MSFLAKEISVEDGQPVDLFRFSNTEEVFAFTNGQKEVVFNSERYFPVAISNGELDRQDARFQRLLTVNVSATNPFAIRYINTVPATMDLFELFRLHTTDGATPEVQAAFTGRVMAIDFKGDTAEISIQTFGAVLDRLIPQQTSRNPCNHILYDSKCQVIDTDFAIGGAVSAVSDNGLEITIDTGTNIIPNSGLQLTAQLLADPTFFNGGFIARGNIELRMIRGVVDDTGNKATLTVLFPMQTISVGVPLTMFAGCDHQLPTCIGKFANVDRYGGFPFIPLKNPFTIGVA